MAILGSHEFGHYVLARRHGVSASLPYFIPLPLLGFGTLGAVIRVRDRIPSRNALVDIGAAGPLAGFLVALPFLAWGYAHSSWVVAAAADRRHRARPTVALGVVRHGMALALGDVTIYGGQPPPPAFRQLFLGSPPAPGTDVARPSLRPRRLVRDAGDDAEPRSRSGSSTPDISPSPSSVAGRGRWVGWHCWGLAVLVVFVSFSWTPWLLVVVLVVGVRHPAVTRPDEPLGAADVCGCAR